MIDEIYNEFFADHQTERALDSSEVWKSYFKNELRRDELRKRASLKEKIDEENKVLSDLEEFRQQVEASPKLKQMLKNAATMLEQHPELKEKVDANFLNGLAMLDLKD
jgi:CRISPR/Cas system-associated protein Cas5 (RAMP superfamily)